MDEHKKTEDEIKLLQEVELPKWEKRRKEAELAVKRVKMLRTQVES
jgi:hypothetical protein